MMVEHDKMEEGSLATLRCALERSASLPLHIHVVMDNREWFQQLVDIVRAESHRWATFTYDHQCYNYDPDPHEPLIFPPKESLEEVPSIPNLYEMQIKYQRYSDSQEPMFRSVTAERFPKLTKMVLVEWWDWDVFANLPWQQLEHLEFLHEHDPENHPDGVPVLWLAETLSRCKRLETLVLHPCPWERSDPPEMVEPVVNETLRTLEFRPNVEYRKHGAKGPSILGLEWLTAPRLENLVLPDLDMEREVDSIVKMVEQSYCQLKRVACRGMMMSDRTVERFLRAVGGSILSLTLEGQIFEHLFECIRDKEDFLPYLEELEVKLDRNTVVSPPVHVIIELVKARRGRGLKRVEVEVYSVPEDEDEEDDEEAEEDEENGDDEDGEAADTGAQEGEEENGANDEASEARLEGELQDSEVDTEGVIFDGEDFTEESEAEDDEPEPWEELETLATDKLVVKVKHIQADYYDGTEINQIRRYGILMNNAVFKDLQWSDLVNLRENMPVFDKVFVIIENCSPELYENHERDYVLRLATLRHVLERFYKKRDTFPKDYNLAQRAERLLDDRFGWNPNGRKRNPQELRFKA
ncbi:hypothetical protein PQX77_014848 [Marasmius sp. AFHP31]|nr:hypothetical protein PQX77_014848 [Marasmius sp. AFHP31]